MKDFRPTISASINRKGVLDIDTVKGCELGMKTYPNGGCYGLCYAAKLSSLYGYNFAKCTSREFTNRNQCEFGFVGCNIGNSVVLNVVKTHSLDWFRIGTMGDPSHDWKLTLELCEWLFSIRTPVIITKHWITIPAFMLCDFAETKAVFNTSVSALDTEQEIEHRLEQHERLKRNGCKSILRIVSCKFGDTENGKKMKGVQDWLFSLGCCIDNPLRIPKNDYRVLCGDIMVTSTRPLSISQQNKDTYTGHCKACPDQCGLNL